MAIRRFCFSWFLLDSWVTRRINTTNSLFNQTSSPCSAQNRFWLLSIVMICRCYPYKKVTLCTPNFPPKTLAYYYYRYYPARERGNDAFINVRCNQELVGFFFFFVKIYNDYYNFNGGFRYTSNDNFFFRKYKQSSRNVKLKIKLFSIMYNNNK